MAMASGRLRTPGKRVHSEPTRRPIVRSGALELAGAKRSIQRSLLRSTIQWTRAWPSLLLAGGKRAPFSRRPSLTPESTTSWWIPVGYLRIHHPERIRRRSRLWQLQHRWDLYEVPQASRLGTRMLRSV